MPKRRLVDIRREAPLLDVVSLGRRGPGAPPLTRAQIAHAGRTVQGVPEVMVRVSGGARTVRGVQTHVEYIGRDGEAQVESDQGEMLEGKGFEKALLEDWDLDLEATARRTERTIAAGRKPPKLVHNLIFSMPKGTPPDKLRAAVRKFAMEKFALQHRYAMARHTDQGAPHVHVVVKAMSEQGVRLNIKKATLRGWRGDFAQYLRELGVPANATERAVRGQTRTSKTTGIFRAMERRDSTHYRERVEGVAHEVSRGRLSPEKRKAQIIETRKQVVQGWLGFASHLETAGQREIADRIRRFVARMPPGQTEKEWIAEELMRRVALEQMPVPSHGLEDGSRGGAAMSGADVIMR
jgi:relaxase-like protein